MKIVNVEVPGPRLVIAPLGDIQWGNEGFSTSKWHATKKRLEQLAESAPVRIVGTGDYLDFMSPSNRGAYKASGLYSSSQRAIQFRTAWPMVDELFQDWPSEGPVTVALARGHHWFHYAYPDMDEARASWVLEHPTSGDTLLPGDTDQHLAFLLGAKYVPYQGLIRFNFPNYGKTFSILLWHGEGNGKSLAYGINKLKDISNGWGDIDAIVMGHTHRLAGTSDLRLFYNPTIDGLVAQNIILLNSGSFLKGFLLGESAYPETRGLIGHLALGHGIIRVNAANAGREKFELSTELYW